VRALNTELFPPPPMRAPAVAPAATPMPVPFWVLLALFQFVRRTAMVAGMNIHFVRMIYWVFFKCNLMMVLHGSSDNGPEARSDLAGQWQMVACTRSTWTSRSPLDWAVWMLLQSVCLSEAL